MKNIFEVTKNKNVKTLAIDEKILLGESVLIKTPLTLFSVLIPMELSI